MKRVNCDIEVSFAYQSSEPEFDYLLTTASPGWQVSTAGNIRPPDKQRVVRLRLVSPADAEFYGLRFANNENEFPSDPDSKPFFNDTGDQAQIIDKDSPRALIFELDHQTREIYYQLGLKVNGSIIWDDPRIYSDGSQ